MEHFNFLKKEYGELYDFCSDAERFIKTDSSVGLLKSRQAIECILGLVVPIKFDTLDARIGYLLDKKLASPRIISSFRLIKNKANLSIHNKGNISTKGVIKALLDISLWLVTIFGSGHKVNPLVSIGEFSYHHNVNDADIWTQDILETEEEFKNRIESMEPLAIGEVRLNYTYIEKYCQIVFPKFNLYRNNLKFKDSNSKIIALIAPVTDDVKIFNGFLKPFTRANGGLKHTPFYNGVLKAKLRVHNGEIFYDYDSLILSDNNGIDIKITAVSWEKFGYENDDDFSKRISRLPMLPVCFAQPLKAEYDIVNEVLPFAIKPMEYTNAIINVSKIKCSFNRFDAKNICLTNANNEFYVYANISDTLTIYNLHFFNPETGVQFTSDEKIEAKHGDRPERIEIAKTVDDNGDEIEKNKEEAFIMYKQETGKRPAIIELANYCANGINVDSDEERLFIGYKGKYESRGPHSNSIKKTGWFLYFAAERCSLDIDVDDDIENIAEEAFKLYNQAAGKGVAKALYSLAECYSNGNGVEKDEKAAFSLYKNAAENGVSKAQYELAECYYNGNGVEKNIERALDWYSLAAAQGNPEAKYKIFDYFSKDINIDKERAFMWFKKAVQQGYNKIKLTNYCSNDFGVNKDKDKLYQLYKEEEKALDLYLHSPWLQNKLRQLGDEKFPNEFFDDLWEYRDYKYLTINVFRDADTRKKMTEELEKMNFKIYQRVKNKWIQYFIAKNYSVGDDILGHDIKISQEKAFKLYKIAAEKGLAKAQYALAECYYKGNGVDKDEEKAFDWYLKAASQGLPEAQLKISNCFSNDIVVEKDELEAFRLYREAIKSGQGIIEWANRFSNGNGIEKNAEKAFELYQKIENKWFLYFTAQSYFFGEGVEKDVKKAFKLYKQAAEKGVAKAQYALAECYYNGNGVEKNEETALNWYLNAVAQGLPEARYKIANCFFNMRCSHEEGRPVG